MPEQRLRGSCACGKITFCSSELPKKITYCYCVQCAKVSGAGFLPFVAVSPATLEWSRQPDIWHSSKFATRGFCASCGSSLFMQYLLEKDEISLALSAVDDSAVLSSCTRKHIFLKEKAAWVVVPDDGASRYEQHETEFQQQFESWVSDAGGESNKH